MTWVSYAQNYEDVTLLRALGDVASGFYIDVGANDPRFDSVTRAFYERGWHGINIEPVPHWHERLRSDRPRDLNLRVAAGRTFLSRLCVPRVSLPSSMTSSSPTPPRSRQGP